MFSFFVVLLFECVTSVFCWRVLLLTGRPTSSGDVSLTFTSSLAKGRNAPLEVVSLRRIEEGSRLTGGFLEVKSGGGNDLLMVKLKMAPSKESTGAKTTTGFQADSGANGWGYCERLSFCLFSAGFTGELAMTNTNSGGS